MASQSLGSPPQLLRFDSAFLCSSDPCPTVWRVPGDFPTHTGKDVWVAAGPVNQEHARPHAGCSVGRAADSSVEYQGAWSLGHV